MPKSGHSNLCLRGNAVVLVEYVVVNDRVVHVGEAIPLVSVGRKVGVEEFGELVEELFDAVDHVLANRGVGGT